MVEIELGRLLNDLDRFSWKKCVYIQADTAISPMLPCLIMDDDTAELGSDDFTPLEVEQRGMIEFLSVQDLKGVIKFLENSKADASTDVKCAAAAYYFSHDAFMPTRSEPSLTGILGEAFRISGRGTVLIVKNYDGNIPSNGLFQVGEFSSKITGVDFPRKFVRGDDGELELDKSMIGICIEDDVKERLLEMKGQLVEVFEF